MSIYMEILVESLVIVTVISAAACSKIPVLALSLCCRTSSEHLLLLDSLLNLILTVVKIQTLTINLGLGVKLPW